MIEAYFGAGKRVGEMLSRGIPFADDRQRNREIGIKEKWSQPGRLWRGTWATHDSGLNDYSDTFNDVLKTSLSLHLKASVENNPNASILDIAAAETAVREATDLGFKYGLAVSLGFGLGSLPPAEASVIEIVNGDIVEQSTWQTIDEHMRANAVPTFDVILSRPLRGLHHFTNSVAMHFELLQRAWRILSPQNGQLLFQIPHMTFGIGVDYLEKLNATSGITVAIGSSFQNIYGVSVHLQRNPEAPKLLPTPKMLGISLHKL
jgi:hypothetical protein